MAPKTETPYLKRVLGFYFAPVLWSFFTILYLLFFLYFILFYLDNLILAIKFLFYTFNISTPLLVLPHLFWGALFVVSLIIPFSLSIYAICLPYEISKLSVNKLKKTLLMGLVLLSTIDAVLIVDMATRFISEQAPIAPFIEAHGLMVRLK
jgi:hypothetical protein